MRVAVVGMGRMGAAMARRIAAESDHELIVFNRTPTRRSAVAADTGAQPRPRAPGRQQPRRTWCWCRWPTMPRCFDAYRGGDGLLAGLRAGTVVCDTSTVAPDTVQSACRRRSRSAARSLLDTPVSGQRAGGASPAS